MKKIICILIVLAMAMPVYADTFDDMYQMMIASGKNVFALDFDGANDVVVIPKGADVDLKDNTEYSWEFIWDADSDGEGDSGVIYGKLDSRIYTLEQDGTGVKISIKLDFGAGTDMFAKTTPRYSLGVKRHCIVTWNEDGDGKGKIYMDGSLQALTTDNASAGAIQDDTGKDMYLGDRAGSKNNIYDGRIYDFLIYPNKALTSAEVTTRFNGGSVAGASAHWDFSEGEGTVLGDIVSSNNGTIDGATWVETD